MLPTSKEVVLATPIVRIDARALVDRDQFHATFAEKFGFFDGYGRNMDAWIDCMSTLRDTKEALTQVHIGAEDTLTILLEHYDVLRDEAPKHWRYLIECAAFLNLRAVEAGERPLIAFAF
jgi:RNAse (barnase) inhibitor barstar